MISDTVSPFICTINIAIFIRTISLASDSNCNIENYMGESFANMSFVQIPELKIKYDIINATVVLIFLDHGWIQVDWDFYEARFILLANRIAEAGKYTNVILSPNYFAFDPYFSISGIFLHIMNSLNRNRTAKRLPKIKVWLHLRSQALHELHEEKLVIPLLTNNLISYTLTGLLLEAAIFDPLKEWSWKGLSVYRKAVNSMRKDVEVKLALLIDRYQCIYLPMSLTQEVFENFDVVYLYDFKRLELEQAVFRLQTSNERVSMQRRVLIDRVVYEDCNAWLSATVKNVKMESVRGIFYGMENEEFFNFTEVQFLM